MIKKQTLPQLCLFEFVLVNTTYSYTKSVTQATRKSRVSLACMYSSHRGTGFSGEMHSDGSCVHGIVVSSSYVTRIIGWSKTRLLLGSVLVITSLKLDQVCSGFVLSPIRSHNKHVSAAVWLRIPISCFVTLRRWLIGFRRFDVRTLIFTSAQILAVEDKDHVASKRLVGPRTIWR